MELQKNFPRIAEHIYNSLPVLHEEADLLFGHYLIMLSFLRWIWWATHVAFSTVSSFHFASLFCLPNSGWSCEQCGDLRHHNEEAPREDNFDPAKGNY